MGQTAQTDRVIIDLPSRRKFTEAWLLWLNLNAGASSPVPFMVNTGSAFGAAQAQTFLGLNQGLLLRDWHRHPVPAWRERIILDVRGAAPEDLVNWNLYALENTIRTDWRM